MIDYPRSIPLVRAFAAALVLALCAAFALIATARPTLHWPDRRPVGALFLASTAHVSASNPRGWFNSPALDVRGAAGAERFRTALLAYADRSIAILKQTNSQGMIVWDLEGEEFPHKTTYIGDPRLLAGLAPEQAAAADEFFRRFRDAGLRVGLTVRPQQLTFSSGGQPHQKNVSDDGRLLLDKIDYARRRWGATLFYIDSNAGPLLPMEASRLRDLARQRPDVLLIPEHHDLRYYSFSAPYASMQRGASTTGRLVRLFYPDAFQVLSIADSGRGRAEIEAARANRDILLFPAWFAGPAVRQLTESAFRQN